jgi:hypothetical protein
VEPVECIKFPKLIRTRPRKSAIGRNRVSIRAQNYAHTATNGQGFSIQWCSPFFLTIAPRTYILVGFVTSSSEQFIDDEANSLTYDQGPALLSRSLL